MKILVLGGNGFIGSHVVDGLLSEGHQVRVYDRTPEHYRAPIQGVEYRFGEFSDSACIAEALTDVDAVCHLISTMLPATSNMDPLGDIQGNLINTVQLLEQMRKQGVQRILYLSSGGTVYGNPEILPIPETHQLRPICSYGVVKVAIENYLMMYKKLYGFKPIVLRPSNPYGPRQSHTQLQGVISMFLGKYVNSEPLEIWGDGSIVRDYMYIDDLSKLCVKALESDLCGIFNAGSGEGHSINEIVTLIDSLFSEHVDVIYHEGRDFDVKKVVLDIRAVKSELDWEPMVALADGIEGQLQWLKLLKRTD